MSRKIEIKSYRVRVNPTTVREVILVDGVEKWAGEYWTGSEKSCEAHDDRRSAALADLDITEEEARQAEFDAWNNG